MLSALVSEAGTRVATSLDQLRLPAAAADAADLTLIRSLAPPTAATERWATLLADHGATDMWVQLARGLEERAGRGQALVATELLRDARDAGRIVRTRAAQLFERPRPYVRDASLPEVVYRGHPSSSFPSGHALGTYASARIMATLDPTNADAYWGLAREVAMSRVVGRVHHPSDIVAGAQIGSDLAGELLRANGYTPAVRPDLTPMLQLASYGGFGNDAEAAARLLTLMPADVRDAGPIGATAGDALHAWFTPRDYDVNLRF